MILLQEFLVQPSLPLSPEADLHVVHHIGKPLGADLNKSPTQVWKLLRQPVGDKTGKEVDRAELELREACAPAKDVKHLQVSLRGVHTDGHPQSACLFVHRKKVGVRGKLFSFNSADKNTAGTVLFAEV